MTRHNTIKNLCSESSEEHIAAVIEQAKQSGSHPDRLLQLLEHNHPVYTNRGANGAVRIRGYLLASFEHTGLSEHALPYVLEELDSSNNAFIIAGAAVALRGFAYPRQEFTAYLLRAVERIRHVDNALSFETYKPHWPRATYTSALVELFKTVQWLKEKASDFLQSLKLFYIDDEFSPKVRLEIGKAIKAIEESPAHEPEVCCSDLPARGTFRRKARKKDLAKICFQDQDGSTIGYNEFFSGKPSIAVLFYTRCNNPFRCSLNMTRLGQLQQALRSEGLSNKISLAAITYDPAYDYPCHLHAYSNHRGFITNEHNRCFRVENGDGNTLGILEARRQL